MSQPVNYREAFFLLKAEQEKIIYCAEWVIKQWIIGNLVCHTPTPRNYPNCGN